MAESAVIALPVQMELLEHLIRGMVEKVRQEAQHQIILLVAQAVQVS
jgi:hypothetical protein